MVAVEFRSVRKTFGLTTALDDFSLHIHSGELVCLLGPSGCGKTTALRVLAGFERADSGHIEVDSKDVTVVSVEKRRFGMVFQDYSLFPNMSTRQNIEFGLKSERVPRAERDSIIERMLAITRLEDQADKFPHQMSGGQKQRVALARAIATSPRVLLLDEPLSALDAKVRESLRDEIRRLQQEIGVTTLFVTHDQQEALAIADRVGVMSSGKLEQLASPRELYVNPANAFVASFIGSTNRIPAQADSDGYWRVLGKRVSARVKSGPNQHDIAAIRPEQLALDPEPEGQATVTMVTFLGPLTRVHVNSPALGEVIADLMSADASVLRVGTPVRVRLRDDVSDVVLLDAA